MRREIIGDAELPVVWIYALCDPDTNEPRYVGKTGRYMCDRHKDHIRAAMKGSRLPVHSWMRGVMEAKKYLVIRDLELVRDRTWAERERHWIAKLRQAGVLLFNVTDGGEGLTGVVRSAEARAKISAKLKKGSTFECLVCGESFWRKPKDIRKGHNKFCSRRCSNNRHNGPDMFHGAL